MRPAAAALATARFARLPLFLALLLLGTHSALAAPRRARATAPPALRRRDPTGYTFEVSVTVHVTVPITLSGLAEATGGGGLPGLPGLPRSVETVVVAVATVAFTPPEPAPVPTPEAVVVTQWATDVATEDVTDYQWVTEVAEPETTAWPEEETTTADDGGSGGWEQGGGGGEEEAPPEEAPVDEGTVEHYGQCGGNNWGGGTVCVAPWECSTANEWYAQCL